MDEYIGFYIDSKKTVTCFIQKGKTGRECNEHEQRTPMKSSKSNNKIPVATNFFWGILVTTYKLSVVACLNSFSASRCNDNGHRESAYVMVKVTHQVGLRYSTNLWHMGSSSLIAQPWWMPGNPRDCWAPALYYRSTTVSMRYLRLSRIQRWSRKPGVGQDSHLINWGLRAT